MTSTDAELFGHALAHDLRAPLRAIAGYVRVIEREHSFALGDDKRRLFSVVCNETARMESLVDGLAEYTAAASAPFHKSLVDMTALARDASRRFSSSDSGALLPDVGELPCAVGDAALLRIVWEQLISNAAKYSSGRTSPHVRVSGRVEESRNVYVIEDNGIGFTMKYYDKLFKIFGRLHRSGEFEGIGIGLAIAHRVLRRHRGRIWAQAEVGVGATFSFSLPREQYRRASTQGPA